FQVGLAVAIASTALCAWSAVHHHFWLVVAGTMLAGYYNANAGLYRFAATEIVAPEFKERAISWVLAGGILGAVAGPNLARLTRNLLPTEFAGAYAALALSLSARWRQSRRSASRRCRRAPLRRRAARSRRS